MKKINIPQEENSTLAGQKKVMYAPNTDGKFERFNYGSGVEEYATKLAVQEYEVLKKRAIMRIKENIASPIEYYMYQNRMDLKTLSSAVGMFGFRVKRHLKADVFKNLSVKILDKYAQAFDIEVEELKGFKA